MSKNANKIAKQNMTKEMLENIKNYADKIETIESFVEVVRKMPGMYIGDKGFKGKLNMFREVFQNCTDEIERVDSPCDQIWVEYNEIDGSAVVMDNGRGIPYGHIIRIFTSQHTGSNYTKSEGQFTSGKHGVGSKVTNALSKYFIVESYILGEGRRVEFHEGVAWDKGEVVIPNPHNLQGTRISYMPSVEAMGEEPVPMSEIYSLIRMILSLVKIGSIVHFTGITKNGKTVKEEMVNTDGIVTDLILRTKSPLTSPITMSRYTGTIKADIAFVYDLDDIGDEDITTFANYCPTKGGTHLDGFLDGLTRYMRDYMNKVYLSTNKKNKLTVTNSDIKSGLKGVISVSVLEPTLEGQSKERLNNPEVVPFVSSLVKESLDNWVKTNPKELQKLCKYLKDVAEVRTKSEAGRVKLSTKYSSSTLSGLPKKYIKPAGNKNLELIICEGDSAAGSAKNGRCPQRQGVYPIRGKVPNVLKCKREEALSNEEIAGIITLVSNGNDKNYGRNFDIKKVPWEKIIFTSDADPDGAHIDSLLGKIFLVYMPELIKAGRVYRAVPPLYGIPVGKDKTRYFTDRLEFTEYLQKLFTKEYSLQTMKKTKLKNTEVLEILYSNIDYVYDLEVFSNTYALSPKLVEYMLPYFATNSNPGVTKLRKEIKKHFRFMDVQEEKGVMILRGLIDQKYQTMFINQQFLNDVQRLYSYVDVNNKNYLMNGNVVTLYDIMKTFEKLTPKKLTRYKGLGEMNAKQLGESTIHPDSERTLIQYTINDLKADLEAVRYLDDNTKELIKDVVVSRNDLIG